MQPQSTLLDKLNRCLGRFKGVPIKDIHEHYDYFPRDAGITRTQAAQAACLGKGGFGAAYRMKSVTNPNEPVRVVKVIPKDRVWGSVLDIQHLSSELAVSDIVQHPNINHRVGLYHTDDNIYIPMELVEGKVPDLATRLYCIFAKHGPKSRIADVPRLVAECPPGGEEQLVASVLRHVGPRVKEDPLSADVCSHIMHHKLIPVTKALIILKQALKGLHCLHYNAVVHRDVKTENLVLGEERKATPIVSDEEYVDEGGNKATRQVVVGVRIEETLTVRVIDFGLVKSLLGHPKFLLTPSPGSAANAAVDIFDGAAPMVPRTTAPVTATTFTGLNVEVTPYCGTTVYTSLEAIRGTLSAGHGAGLSKWLSGAVQLCKFDIFGAGTMLYCMCIGSPPFRPRSKGREAQTREMEQLLQAGLQFPPHCPEFIRPLISWLMENDVNVRPSAAEALQDPLFRGLTNKYVYEVMVDGTVHEVKTIEGHAEERTTSGGADSATATAADNEEEGQQPSALDVRGLMRAVRGREDEGDSGDKNVDEIA